MIKRLNWDVVDEALAVWPSPIAADVCFENGGFTDFEESEDDDELWDQEVGQLIRSAI